MRKTKKEVILRICKDLDSDFQKLAIHDNRSKSKEMIIALYSYVKKIKAKQPQIFNSESQSQSESKVQEPWDEQDEKEWNELIDRITSQRLYDNKDSLSSQTGSESTSQSVSDSLDVAPTTKKKGRKKKIKYDFSFSGSDSLSFEDYLKEESHKDFLKWAESLTSENKNGKSDS